MSPLEYYGIAGFIFMLSIPFLLSRTEDGDGRWP